MSAPLGERLFDYMALAQRLRAALAERGGLSERQAAVQARVSPPTFWRAVNGDPSLTHETVLRLEAWIGAGAAEQQAVAA